MNEELNLKLSQYIDNELEPKERVVFEALLNKNSELQARLERYQLMRQAIKLSPVTEPVNDFLNAIKQQLEHEPIYFLPKRKRVFDNFKPMAIAVSLLLVAVLTGYSVKTIQLQLQEVAGMQVAQNAVNNNVATVSAKAIEYPINKQISDYLQAHNEELVGNVNPPYQPYARVSSYGQK